MEVEGGNVNANGAEEKTEKPELELDSPTDSRAKIAAGTVGFNSEDTTLNVMPMVDGRLLMCLGDGGFQHLLAGARANVGVISGRYMFEATVVECKDPAEPAGSRNVRSSLPKQLLRVGYASADADLLLPDAESVCFDSEGRYLHDQEERSVTGKMEPGTVLAVVLNLDGQSPNSNTVSLFVNGVRAGDPQVLPTSMRGKPLYPAVTYKNVTVQMHFGSVPMRPLPFKCRTLQDATESDCRVQATSPMEKPEVLYPVGLPDEGTFDWLDTFLKENRKYTELSDRMIVSWATKSGLARQRGYSGTTSNDRPDAFFGLPQIDDRSVAKMVEQFAPVAARNFVVLEVKGNLTVTGRRIGLDRFPGSVFKRVCKVVMGEPPAEYRAHVQKTLLDQKRAKVEQELRYKKLEREKKRKADDEQRKAEEEAKKAKKENEDGEEAKEAENAPENGEAEAKADEDEQEENVIVELTQEEKEQMFLRNSSGIPDLTEKEMATFPDFSLPTADEGFDAIQYAWQDEEKCQSYLKEWLLEMKRTQRVDDIKPSEWFWNKWTEWNKQVTEWKQLHSEFKDPRKRAEKVVKSETPESKDEDMDVDADLDVDVFAMEDVTNIGNGRPLFANFEYQDWALLSLRFELHLLVHAFRHDVNDPERLTFHENHVAFYYDRYYRRPFVTQHFACKDFSELLALIEDTIELNPKNSTLESLLSDDTPIDNFIRLTEDHRRERLRRLDEGDKTALLKFQKPAPLPPRAQQPPQQARGYYGQATTPTPQRYSDAPAYGKRLDAPSTGGAPLKAARTTYTSASTPTPRSGYGASYGGTSTYGRR